MNTIIHTGDAPGADYLWATLGRECGAIVNVHTKNGLLNQSVNTLALIEHELDRAAIALGRPNDFPGKDYVRRDWLQVNTGSEQVVAISRIIWPGQKDPKGYINGTTRPVVAGGTGWTVQFGIQAGHK